ncbi:MAG: hypothetical protein ACKOET_09380 [Verrucomicrobiota bacterium]
METNPSPDSAPETRPLPDALQGLQRQLQFALLVGTITSLALLAFMVRVTMLQRRGLASQEPAVERVLREDYPRLRAVLGEFERFGASHPDFADKVLRRYNLRAAAILPAGAAGPGPTATNLPRAR